MLRFVTVTILACVSLFAFADRLIEAPTGRKAMKGEFYYKGLVEAGGTRYMRQMVGYGIDRSFELGVTYDSIQNRDNKASFDVSFNLTDPITDLVPGFAVGVQDVMDRSPLGRRAYVAFTFDVGNDGLFNANVPSEFTVGAGTGEANGLFFCAKLPFSWWLKLIAEHDTEHFTAGLEYRPIKPVYIQCAQRDGSVLWGFGYDRRF